MFKRLLANFCFLLVVLLLAVEYMPNENPYIFVGVVGGISSIGLYGIERFFNRATIE